MNVLAKLAVAAVFGAASVSAHAIEANITVWADVDPTLSLLKADGTALDDVVEMSYRAGAGLTPWTEQVRIYSNDVAKDVEVRLARPAELVTQDAPGGNVVPMSVRLNSRLLTTTVTDFTAAELFNGSIPGASIAMPLTIAQTTQGPITAAGHYEGLVSIVLNQKTTGP